MENICAQIERGVEIGSLCCPGRARFVEERIHSLETVDGFIIDEHAPALVFDAYSRPMVAAYERHLSVPRLKRHECRAPRRLHGRAGAEIWVVKF
jgi:hypothetical protein